MTRHRSPPGGKLRKVLRGEATRDIVCVKCADPTNLYAHASIRLRRCAAPARLGRIRASVLIYERYQERRVNDVPWAEMRTRAWIRSVRAHALQSDPDVTPEEYHCVEAGPTRKSVVFWVSTAVPGGDDHDSRGIQYDNKLIRRAINHAKRACNRQGPKPQLELC